MSGDEAEEGLRLVEVEPHWVADVGVEQAGASLKRIRSCFYEQTQRRGIVGRDDEADLPGSRLARENRHSFDEIRTIAPRVASVPSILCCKG